MRQPLLFIDRGSGWENVTGHQGEVAGLDRFTIDWGTDAPTEQPDVDVLDFQLIDRTGDLAGRAMTLAGAKVMIQLSRMPFWADLHDPSQWQEQDAGLRWSDFHLANIPPADSPMDPTALTLFNGRTTTGGKIQQITDGTWRLELKASSNLVLAKRQTTQGPTSSDPRFAGSHWTVSAHDRLAEIQSRLKALGAPAFGQDALTWIDANLTTLAAYSTDSYPALYTIMSSLMSHHWMMPLIYVAHPHGPDELTLVFMGLSSSITLHSDGHLSVENERMSNRVVNGDQVRIDANELSMPEPISQITLHAKRVTWNESEQSLGFEDDDMILGDRGLLPANLTDSTRSVQIDTDAIVQDDSQGHYQGLQVFAPSDTDRDRRAKWLEAQTMRLRPEGLTLDSRDINIDDFEFAFMPTAMLLGFIRNRFTRLAADDGTPATSGAWMGTGGSLSFEWHDGTPVLRNKMSVSPMPMIPSTMSRWQDLDPIGLTWPSLEFTWAEFGQITYFKQ